MNNDTEQAPPIRYSRGYGKHDNHPQTRIAADFRAFTMAVLKDRSKQKGGAWVAAPFNSDGRRCRANAEPRRFLPVDLDRIRADRLVDVRLWFTRFRGFGYATASSTPEAPRERAMLELSREATRQECLILGAALTRDLAEEFGDAVKADPSVFHNEWPVYTPLRNVRPVFYAGEPLDVDAVLATMPPSEAGGTETPNPRSDEQLRETIRTGADGVHEALTSLAARFYGRGMPDADNIATLRALMEEATWRDTPRWRERYAEINRDVNSAVKKYGDRRARPARKVRKPAARADVALPGDEDQLIEVNQDNVATVFEQRFSDRLRFSHDRGRWYLWDGARWREEGTQLAFDYTRHLTRKLNTERKREFAKAAFCEGVEKFARAARVFAMRGDEWDREPHLLNTPDGTVDLRTGNLRRPEQSDLITKCTSVGPQDRVPHLWLEFLKQATEGDGQLIGFLQRVCGYCLSGLTCEECLFFLYGTGGNGKGTFAGTLFNILGEGEYATNSPMETFLASRVERHSTDLAMLRGARMVTASETAEGRTWDEQRVKALTGNDPITARFMRQDNFTYQPQFKLLLIGNNKPVLRSVDEAWRRRFNVIPFTHKPAHPDVTLKARLVEERSRILSWAIEGYGEWAIGGLQPPERVLKETAVYFESQDTFATWLEDCCTIDQRAVETNSELFKSWAAYCEKHHEPAGNGRAFADRLAARGFRRVKDEFGLRGRGFQGLQVVPFGNLDGA